MKIRALNSMKQLKLNEFLLTYFKRKFKIDRIVDDLNQHVDRINNEIEWIRWSLREKKKMPK